MNDYKIIAYCCHNSLTEGIDQSKKTDPYPEYVEVKELPCSGKIDVLYLLSTFESGADGVMVLGCPEGGCHYLEGNLRARKRVEITCELLQQIGIESERLRMFNFKAETDDFKEVYRVMYENVQALGASPLNKGVKSG